MAAGEETLGPACPRCRSGVLAKHCPPTNRCGWFACDLPCGYTRSAETGNAVVMRGRSDPRRSETA